MVQIFPRDLHMMRICLFIFSCRPPNKFLGETHYFVSTRRINTVFGKFQCSSLKYRCFHSNNIMYSRVEEGFFRNHVYGCMFPWRALRHLTCLWCKMEQQWQSNQSPACEMKLGQFSSACFYVKLLLWVKYVSTFLGSVLLESKSSLYPFFIQFSHHFIRHPSTSCGSRCWKLGDIVSI